MYRMRKEEFNLMMNNEESQRTIIEKNKFQEQSKTHMKTVMRSPKKIAKKKGSGGRPIIFEKNKYLLNS